jgi:signal transduction histidine kinase
MILKENPTMQIKKAPLEGGGDSSIFPSVLCRGQCRYEQEEEYREIFHELRNSLTGIILGLGNIEHHWNHLTLSEVMRSIQHLKEMAMFMGDLMNRDNLPGLGGQGLLSSEELDLTIVVAKAVKNNIVRAAVKDITLTFHPLVLSTIILGDRIAILQIAENLLSNAIKFSPRHSSVDVFVVVSTSAAASLQNSEQWEIPLEENEVIRFVRMEVHDKGPGVTL